VHLSPRPEEVGNALSQLLSTSCGTPDQCLSFWDGAGGTIAALARLQRQGRIQCPELLQRYFTFALPLLARSGPGIPLGLLGGNLGIYAATLECANSLQASDLEDILRELLPELAESAVANLHGEFDMGGGIAGSICVLIWSARRLGVDLSQTIGALADKLVRFLEPRGIGLTPAIPSAWCGPIPGIAHGISGVSLAMLEAAIYLQSSLLLHLAKALFATDSCLRHPDLMWPLIRPPVPNSSIPQMKSANIIWCYGAAGTSFVARRFAKLTGDYQYLKFSVELQNYVASYICSSDINLFDACCCHGIGGAICILSIDDASRKRFSKTLEVLIGHGSLILDSCGRDDWTRFPTANRRRQNGIDALNMARYSYFTGAGGLALAIDKCISGIPQDELMLPISI